MADERILHCFVINNFAGDGKAAANAKVSIASVCAAGGVDYELYETKSRGDATVFTAEKAKVHDGRIRFYACGGDGTINEVANGIMRAYSDGVPREKIEMGIFPVGSGNDFVRNFTNTQYFFEVKRQLDGVKKQMDLIKYGGKYCVNVLNMGFDCEVVIKSEELKKKKLITAKTSYTLGVLSKFFGKYGDDMEITIDGESLGEKKYVLAAFANGRFYGGGFKAAPRSQIDDGMMDMCAVEQVSHLKFLGLVGKYKKGQHLDTPLEFIRYVKCRKVDLRFARPMNVCVDGEIEGPVETLTLETVPKAVTLSIPEGCSISGIAETQE
ncbi:MAG: YegS/Rv2252/BmrU family lipid kinase [Clostridia bacterium]|nr:YegS/Rv2252/BmrU family lipid kinase [Clostridia bacterium]